MNASPDLLRRKRALRDAMRLRRAEGQSAAAAVALRDQFLKHIPLAPGAVIAATFAFESEIDPAPLVAALRSRQHPIAFPVVTGKGQPLTFRLHEAGGRLVKSRFGIEEPPEGAPEIVPDVLIIPLLAFDRHGYRLGYGGGFYDRTLHVLRKQKPVLAVGAAYSFQETETVPRGPDDARLDKIVTEIQAFTSFAPDRQR